MAGINFSFYARCARQPALCGRTRHAGVEPDRIIYSGVGKRAEEIEEALVAGIRAIHIESEMELAAVALLSVLALEPDQTEAEELLRRVTQRMGELQPPGTAAP